MQFKTHTLKILTLSICTIAAIYYPLHGQGDGYIRYCPIVPDAEQLKAVEEFVADSWKNYDRQWGLITTEVRGWNAHSDLRSGRAHQIVGSLYFALALMNTGDEKNAQEAFRVIENAIAAQNTEPGSRSRGVWPYYAEESLTTFKSVVDGNMADFNAATLLDIYMGHEERLPPDLRRKMKDAIILAAQFIQNRDVDMVYTNIAIMGTNVTYVTGHLFDIPEMKTYAADRLRRLYDFTLENGYAEYNSPDYMMIALDELGRMKRYIAEPGARMMVDSIYNIGWDMTARHYHKPTAQWTGPQSRSYNEFTTDRFYGFLYNATGGRVDNWVRNIRPSYIHIEHKLPEYLLPYFLSPEYPRTEKDTFETKELGIYGTTYLTEDYALGTSTKSSMWYQRRPLLAYWGTPDSPFYMRPKMLMGGEELSTATIFTQQKDNYAIAAINFATNGAFRHLLTDLLYGILKTDDLRLRFMFGNASPDDIVLPSGPTSPTTFTVDGIRFDIGMFYAGFPPHHGYWEKGSDGRNAFLDYVIYSGPETELDLNAMDEAVMAFTFRISTPEEASEMESPVYEVKEGKLEARWKGLNLSVPVKPGPRSKYLYL